MYIPVSFDGNYGEDSKKLGEFNRVAGVYYHDSSGEVSICFNIGTGDHYVNMNFSLSDLLEAVGRAIADGEN